MNPLLRNIAGGEPAPVSRGMRGMLSSGAPAQAPRTSFTEDVRGALGDLVRMRLAESGVESVDLDAEREMPLQTPASVRIPSSHPIRKRLVAGPPKDARSRVARGSIHMGGYQTGGAFVVPGDPEEGPDSQRVTIDATPGEQVTVTPPQAAGFDFGKYISAQPTPLTGSQRFWGGVGAGTSGTAYDAAYQDRFRQKQYSQMIADLYEYSKGRDLTTSEQEDLALAESAILRDRYRSLPTHTQGKPYFRSRNLRLPSGQFQGQEAYGVDELGHPIWEDVGAPSRPPGSASSERLANDEGRLLLREMFDQMSDDQIVYEYEDALDDPLKRVRWTQMFEPTAEEASQKSYNGPKWRAYQQRVRAMQGRLESARAAANEPAPEPAAEDSGWSSFWK